MNDFEKVKEAIDLVSWASKKWQTKQIGANSFRINPCPIEGKHKDAFTIDGNKQLWKCFSCGIGGDIFSLLIETKQAATRYDALKILAKEIGYELSEAKLTKKSEEEKQLQEIFNAAAEFYHNNFNNSEKAKKYIQKNRKRAEIVMKKAKYGFANGHSLYEYLLSKGFKKEIILKSGLVKRSADKIYDFFGHDLFIYPVFKNGKVSDFFCKDYFQENKSKRRNYQIKNENKLNGVLFDGQEAIYAREFVIVEGKEDRLSILQNYKIPVVATLGSLSQKQIEFFVNNIHENATIYLAFDPDAAGIKYRRKIIHALAGKANLRQLVWDFTIGDIDDYICSEIMPTKAIESLIRNSIDAIDFEISELPDMKKMDTWNQQKYYQPILEYISKIDNQVSINRYIELLCEKLGSKTIYFKALVQQINSLKGISEPRPQSAQEENDLPLYGIQRIKNQYYRITEKIQAPVSNFILSIKRQLRIEDEIHYEVQLINKHGVPSPLISLDPETCVNHRKFSKTVKGAGQYHYFGDDKTLSEIWMLEEERLKEIPMTNYYKRFGYIEEEDLWLFSNCIVQGRNVFEEKDGTIVVNNNSYLSHNVFVYSGDRPILNTTFKPTREWIDDIIHHFWIMFDHKTGYSKKIEEIFLPTFRGFLALGYLGALAYRFDWIKIERRFPHFMVYGPSGTGKSEAVRLLMNCLGWKNEGEPWQAATEAGMSYALEQLSSLPYWLEEYVNLGNKDKKQQARISVLRNIYNLSSSEKATLSGLRKTNKVNGAILLTGQNRVDDRAALSRFVILRKEKPSVEASESYFHLCGERERLSALFLWILRHKNKEKTDEYIQNIYIYKDEISKKLKERGLAYDERSVINHSIIAAGFNIFDFQLKTADKTSELYSAFVDWLADQVYSDQERVSNQEIIYDFFSNIEVVFRDEMYNYVKKQGNRLYLAFQHLYNEWRKNRNIIGGSENISANDLRDYMEKDSDGYWIDLGKDNRINYEYHGRTNRWRSICLDVEKLPSAIKDIVEGWKDSFED